MSGRKLSRRQKWRIEKIQQERKARAEKKKHDAWQSEDLSELGPEQTGFVIAHFGQSLIVERNDSEHIRCLIRANIQAVVCGDEVVFRQNSAGDGVVEALSDRKSVLKRPDTYGKLKPVAANIDQIIIVIAPEPVPHANLIDRYLVAAETIGIPPVILFNKIDLIDEANKDFVESIQDQYRALDYPVIETCALDSRSLAEQIQSQLVGKTSVFVGQSGVGKSTLINGILPDANIRTGSLSEAERKGKHTTTTARLYRLQSGGSLIDSPGIREFSLWHIGEDILFDGFIEFRSYRGLCRFRDCKHINEPGCALKQAVLDGNITQARLDSYFRIRESLNDKETFE